ncbi:MULTISPECIES: pilus assembly protein PilP [unclassified Arenimonas]|uniref:pilus assembly protein PilP n=1 Tax=unclassified Arenimonas TaxID=2641713 RepID=UPI00086A2E47|nr:MULTISPECIES: pilus assembly protein PilP [unclassified Arenimonas]ODS64564.1 MAG: fimbrial protein [Arenimonas sp. SCN 70-307]
MTRKAMSGLLVAAVVLSLSACTRGSRDLEAWVAEVKARPAPPLDPLPVMKQFETFEYAAQDMRDPFSQPSADRDGGNQLRPDPNRRKEVLEAFPLDSLDMVGTIGSGPGVIGLVMGPDRVTHRVRPGNYLGLNDGRITAVTEDRIEIVELVPDGAGGWLERQARIALEDN